MNYYLKLQFTRFQRWCESLGLSYYLGIIGCCLAFVGLSSLLFFKIENAAPWILLFFALYIIVNAGNTSATRQAKNVYTKLEFRKIRCLENIMIAAPFLLYLVYKSCWMEASILVPVSIVCSLIHPNLSMSRIIPTPFRSFPFEYIRGFRKSFWLVALFYFLIIKSIEVANYNLGVFGMFGIFIVSLFYYQKPEDRYFVWIYDEKPSQFLLKKYIMSIICVNILVCLPLGALVLVFTEQWWITVLVYLYGSVLLGSVVLARYSSFPFEMNIPYGILYGVSLVVPLVLPYTMWLFYKKSRSQLEPILG